MVVHYIKFNKYCTFEITKIKSNVHNSLLQDLIKVNGVHEHVSFT